MTRLADLSDPIKLFSFRFRRSKSAKMPALDLELINQLGRDLHPSPNGLMAEDEVCPWTLFLTMALTLLKGKSIGRQRTAPEEVIIPTKAKEGQFNRAPPQGCVRI